MREQPPDELVDLLEQLSLATPGQVRSMRRRTRRLAADLPCFESVWVDALAQARILTRLQAAEINAGRGRELRVGPFVICRRLQWPLYADSFLARRIDVADEVHGDPSAAEANHRDRYVRLLVSRQSGSRRDEILDELKQLIERGRNLDADCFSPVRETGVDLDADGCETLVWAAAPWVDGYSAARWMANNGRFPPQVVLYIAQSTLAALGKLEQAGLCHGDLSTAGLIITDSGRIVLPTPGLRRIFRPEEGYAHADLPPEAYDYLAPERVADGGGANIAADIFACGCVWWHLLCGRPPLSGGDSLAKLRGVQDGRIRDARRFAPELPRRLAATMVTCLDKSPERRGESIARLADSLGPATSGGKQALSRCLGTRGESAIHRAPPTRTRGNLVRASLRAAASVFCVSVAAAVIWPLWQSEVQPPPASITAESRPAETVPNDETAGDSTDAESPRSQTTANSEVETVEYAPAEKSGFQATEDMVLAAGGPLVIEALELRQGQTVRGAEGQRPLVMVPRRGLIVEGENVRFEGIDFLWDHDPEEVANGTLEHGRADAQAALLVVLSDGIEFRGCCFRSARRSADGPVAVRWSNPHGEDDLTMSLPSGRLRMSDCVLHAVSATVDCRRVGALRVELDNVLRLGGGPLVRLDRCPRADEPITVALSRVTLRGGGPLLGCAHRHAERRPGEIAIRTSLCALVVEEGQPLLLLEGPAAAEQLLQAIYWTGDGSIVSPKTTIAAWRNPDGELIELDDSSITIAGVVRSGVEFAEDADMGPAASRIIRWQAPLRSTDPPGIDVGPLPRR